MDNERAEALLSGAINLNARLAHAAGATGSTSVAWFRVGAPFETAAPFRVRHAAGSVELNQDLVEAWFEALPASQAERRFAALALRAAAARLFAPPAYEWNEAAELHIRSEQEKGLDSTYANAFWAANTILEAHRLDQRVQDLIPDAGDRLAELVRYDVEGHPTFDVYPRAAIVIGRPSLPEDLARPAFDEFVDQFGIDEAEELTSTLNDYVALDPDAVDEMVDTTARLVFQAFPDAMGLSIGDPTGSDVWPAQGQVPSDGPVGWPDLEALIAKSLSAFTGKAGLDYGDALLIGVDGDPLTGSRLGAWSGIGGINLDLTKTNLDGPDIKALLSRGWEQFENAPESFHKESEAEPTQVASECVWILRDILRTDRADRLLIRGRGAAEQAIDALDWSLGELEPEAVPGSLVAFPEDHEELAQLVGASLAALFGSEPEEYEPGRFRLEVGGIEVAVLASRSAFPAIRFHHRVLYADDAIRTDVISFANVLHGRSSTTGSHWWLGDDFLWQVAELWARKFDQEIFNDHLTRFVDVALDRTPEIRARFELDSSEVSPLVPPTIETDEPELSEGDDAGGAIEAVLADAGLAVPPLGAFGVEEIRAFGRWHWGTYELSPFEMYMFEVEPVVAALLDEGHLFAMSHAGHGLNSYGLNVVVTGGPFAAFVQHGFGGVYTDPLWARLRINEAYTNLHVLLQAKPLPDSENPRWLLLHSQFRGVCGIVDLDEVRMGKNWESAFKSFPHFGALIRGAVALAPDDEEFIDSGTTIDWGDNEPDEVSEPRPPRRRRPRRPSQET